MRKIIDAHAHVAQYITGFTSKGELRAAGQGKARYSTGEEFQMFPAEMGDIRVIGWDFTTNIRTKPSENIPTGLRARLLTTRFV